MKKIILLIFLLNYFTAFAQKNVTENKVKTIVEEASFYLNGNLNKTFLNGQTRTAIPIQIPQNTIEWYYSFSTNSKGEGTQTLNLGVQLASLLLDPTGLTSGAANKVSVPQGNSTINTYLFDHNGYSLFDRGEAFNYLTEGSRKAVNSGVVKIKELNQGLFYLGIENPSDLDGVNVTIEIIAIVSEDKYIDEWASEGVNTIDKFCMQTFNTNGGGKVEVCECVKGKVKAKYSPNQVFSKEDDFKSIVISLKENCYLDANQSELFEKEKEFILAKEREKQNRQEEYNSFQEYLREAGGANSIGDYKKAKLKMIEALDFLKTTNTLKNELPQNEMVNFYNSIVWFSILDDDKENVHKHLEKGLGINPSNPYLKGNLGLYHLLYGDYNQALSAYRSFKNRYKLPDGRKWGKVISEDLITLENLGKGNANFNKLRKDLKIK